MNSSPYNIGKHLEQLRLSKKFSFRTAAKLCNLSHGYIRDLELGDSRTTGPAIIPQPQTLKKFAEAYNTDFNELMRIAGHIQDTTQTSFQVINLLLQDILYVQVDESNRVQYHLSENIYYENMTLHEFMKLEEQLENNRFIRVHAGTYVNTIHISDYNEKTGLLLVGKGKVRNHVEITWVRAQLFRNILNTVIDNKTQEESPILEIHEPTMLKVRSLNV